MKRTSKLAFAVCFAAVLYGCGDGAETGMMTGPLGPGGAGGVGGVGGNGGNAATGSTWAPVVTGGAGGVSGSSGIGGTGAIGVSGSGGSAGVGGTGGGMAGMSGIGGTGGVGGTGGGASGTGGGASGMGGSSTGGVTPTIPAVTGDCPTFVDSTIEFMGLGGISIVAGQKPASATAPMVFYWHGTASFSGEYAGMAADVVAGVRAEGGVLVSFQGSTGGDLLSGTAIFGESDFELTDQLVACAVQNHNVDPRRIFATGCSAGGLFSGAMAAKRSSYIAAAAPNSGGWTVPVAFETDWTPALMTIHGAAGRDVVFIDFSNSSATADMAFSGRGGFVINCDHGGGHCGGGPLAGEVWEFFKAHPYGTEPSPWASALPAGFSGDCQIY